MEGLFPPRLTPSSGLQHSQLEDCQDEDGEFWGHQTKTGWNTWALENAIFEMNAASILYR